MNVIFKKLNYKEQSPVVVLNSPESFKKQLLEMKDITRIAGTVPSSGQIDFVLAFVTTQQEVDSLSEKLVSQLSVDGLLWFAYPKASSKRYKCDFNRDSGWTILGKQSARQAPSKKVPGKKVSSKKDVRARRSTK